MRDLVTDVSYNFEVAKLIPAFKPGRGIRRPLQDGSGRHRPRPGIPQVHRVLPLSETSATSSGTTRRTSPVRGASFLRALGRARDASSRHLDRRDYIHQDMASAIATSPSAARRCARGLHITDNAIIPLKERIVDSHYDPVAWLGRKITGRPFRSVRASEAANTRVRRTHSLPRRLRRAR